MMRACQCGATTDELEPRGWSLPDDAAATCPGCISTAIERLELAGDRAGAAELRGAILWPTRGQTAEAAAHLPTLGHLRRMRGLADGAVHVLSAFDDAIIFLEQRGALEGVVEHLVDLGRETGRADAYACVLDELARVPA